METPSSEPSLLSLFNSEPEINDEEKRSKSVKVERIPGLCYIPSFLNKEEEALLLSKIDENPWSSELVRRVQHYGISFFLSISTGN